jgi:HEAT repeat protein
MQRFLLLFLAIFLQNAIGKANAADKDERAAQGMPRWIAQLKDLDPGVRVKAAEHLGEYLRGLGKARGGFSDLPKSLEAQPPELDVKTLNTMARDLVIAIGDPEAEVRSAAASALASLPMTTPEIEAALLAGLKNKDRNVRFYVAKAIGTLLPDARKFVPALLAAMSGDPADKAWLYLGAVADYGKDARFAAGELARLLTNDEGEVRWRAAAALRDTGLDLQTAQALVDGQLKYQESEADKVLLSLLSQPKEAVRFLQAHPELPKDVESFVDWIHAALCQGDEDAAALRAGLAEAKELPPLIMGLVQDGRFLPALQEQMKRADPHRKTLLEACARACGAAVGRVVKISQNQKGDFKPTSAWPGVERKRQSKDMKDHGDGFAWVLVTGKLLMADGTPARGPKFYAAGDRPPERTLYEQKTGRFVFLMKIYAAYDMGKGAAEPGPYRTESWPTRIEADGALPLDVQFFDEMPEVEITLQPGDVPQEGRPKPAAGSRP